MLKGQVPAMNPKKKMMMMTIMMYLPFMCLMIVYEMNYNIIRMSVGVRLT